MSGEHAFLESLRVLATDPAARGLLDDVAVLEVGGGKLVLTHDSLVEGVHFLPQDPPESVAWKLIAVNLSDLAAKGAMPLGALMGYTLRGDAEWDATFVAGLAKALEHFTLPLLGGDTVHGAERHLSMTLIGEANGRVPSRSGAQAGDVVYVSGPIGDAGAGLKVRRGELPANEALAGAYLYPQPHLAAGAILASRVSAMMDVSDGLLIDAARMADASGVRIEIDLDAVPLSPALRAIVGEGVEARIDAATAGDDYVLLFTANLPLPVDATLGPMHRVGRVTRGEGLSLLSGGVEVALPERLGWEHGSSA